MKKQIFSALASLSLGLAVGTTGCGDPSQNVSLDSLDFADQGLAAEMTAEDSRGRGIRVAWLGSMPEQVYDAAILRGSRDAARCMGATVTPFYSSFDGPTQLAQCNQVALSRNYDAIVITPADSTGIIPCVENARRRGVSIVATDVPIGNDPSTLGPQVRGQTGAVLTRATSFGATQAALIVETCGTTNPCNIVYFAGFFSSIIDVIALRDLNAAIQAHPNMKLVSSHEAFYDTATAKQLATSLLAQNRSIQVFATSADQMAKGVEQAVNAANLTQRPKITGAGAGAYGVDASKAGRWEGTFIALPYDEGYLGTRMAVRAARGQRLDSNGIDPVARRQLPSFLTTENQAQFVNFVPQWAD